MFLDFLHITILENSLKLKLEVLNTFSDLQLSVQIIRTAEKQNESPNSNEPPLSDKAMKAYSSDSLSLNIAYEQKNFVKLVK